MMTNDQLYKLYNKNKKQINKLYNGYTPVKEIKRLHHMNDVALENELKKLKAKGV